MSITTLKAVIFDLDATLVNLGNFVNWGEAYDMALKAYLSTDCPEEIVMSCSGKGLFNMLNLVRDRISLTMTDRDVQRIQAEAYKAVESFEMHGVQRCFLMPGCTESLEWLRERSVKMAIATSNSQEVAKHILESRGIRHYFSIVIGRRPELRMKPYPDQIYRCLKKMGVSSGNGIVVGDSARDVKAAKAANMFVIAIPAYFTKREVLEEAGADVILESMEELPEILSGFMQPKG